MTTHSTLADTLAAFVHGLNPGTIPPDVQEKARTCLLNGYGMALGGHATPFAPVARTAAMAMDGERP
ncbi:MAG: MmgE/PrpD family protein 4, partial [Gemmatimonadaceae bacterium]|nr:MmgE/PrpD family protein 4 [Acetobacteraceae bacterium]